MRPSRRRLLDAEELTRQLADLPRWNGGLGALRRTVEFATFPDLIRAVDEIAVVAEGMDHHPDLDIRWRTLHAILSTHDRGGVTQWDVELAHRIDEIVADVGGR
jgi:4a-hydroxytetrahydrobiopterin dehydratase